MFFTLYVFTKIFRQKSTFCDITKNPDKSLKLGKTSVRCLIAALFLSHSEGEKKHFREKFLHRLLVSFKYLSEAASVESSTF